jgi:crotonobetainyl-CoA:carnitine CoA-transferase CaiB-like acyl-CoA transferase
MSGPLAHLKVLELSRVLAGPWAAQVLADLGADVIKVERPLTGDDTRAWGPPWLTDAAGRPTGQSAYFASTNRGKRSVAVDLSSEDGQEVVRQLALWADVVIENFKVGGLRQYGLDPAALRALNPRLIVCSITGFGQTGPLAPLPGYDLLVQAMGGLMSLTGPAEGPPYKTGVAVADLMTGMYASTAILAALSYRDRTGLGQHIDLALLDTQVAWLANQGAGALATGRAPARQGNAHPSIVPYEVFEAADGHLVLAVGNDGQFRAFCEVVGRPEWATDARYRSNALRVSHREELVVAIAALLRAHDRATWLTALEARGVPCGPVRTLDEVFTEPQLVHRGAVVVQPHPTAGEVRTLANPMHFSATPVRYDRPPPLLGQHTREVLTGLLTLGDDVVKRLLTQAHGEDRGA